MDEPTTGLDPASRQVFYEIVRELRDRGFFLLRDAAETAGHALGVSRFTIYNYLNEIEGAESAPGPATSSDR